MFMHSNKLVNLFIFISLFVTSNSFANSQTEFNQAISAHQGKVIYVDFWASWCIPCKKSFPWLNKLQTQYGDKGFTVVSVNLDAKRKHANKFLANYPANFPVIYDATGLLAKKYQLKGMPSSFLVDKSGNIVSTHIGFSEDKKTQYEQEIIALFK